MLVNTFAIKVYDLFNLEDIINLLEEYSKNKKLFFCINSDLEWYTEGRDDNDDGVLLINKIKCGHFERLSLTKNDIEKLKKETAGNLDFSNNICYLVKNRVDIVKSVKLDYYEFYALLIENNQITHVLHYTESTEFMILTIDYDQKSDIKEFVKKYGEKHGKSIEVTL